ncbi:MAG: GDYXXLXY domain-containing protein [Pseudomonadota bacterium]
MKNWLTKGLVIAILLQGLILIGMYARASLPLWIGTEIRVKTQPVDPRSLFRGNYARLRYDFSTIPYDEFMADAALRNGEKVYISLQKNASGLYEYADAWLEEPEEGIYLRGRVEQRRYTSARGPVRIKYGIEAYFAPKEKALALEKELRDGGVAVLMVGDDGHARIKAVVSNGGGEQ